MGMDMWMPWVSFNLPSRLDLGLLRRLMSYPDADAAAVELVRERAASILGVPAVNEVGACDCSRSKVHVCVHNRVWPVLYQQSVAHMLNMSCRLGTGLELESLPTLTPNPGALPDPAL